MMSNLQILKAFLLVAFFLFSMRAVEQQPERLNVLFITDDDLNNDLGAYGHELVQSPNIDRLSERGVRFERAYCQYPVCNPSRSSFLTGLYPEQTRVLSNADSFRAHVPNVVTLPEHFKNNGYYTARVGKIFHYGVPGEIGTNGMDDPQSWNEVVNPRGVDKDVEDLINTLQSGQFGGTLSWLNLQSRDEDHTDGIGATEAIRILEKLNSSKTGQPFFLAFGLYRPHTPYVAPSMYFEKYPREQIHPVLEKPGDRDDIPVAALADRPKQRELTVDQRKEIIQAYYASISFMDTQVGRVLDALDRLGLAESTIIVFTSDHGYHLGAHGLWQKGDLFEGSTRVPLIIVDPRKKNGGMVTGAITELVDLYPTLVELCGLPRPAHLKGRSQAEVLDNPMTRGGDAALTIAWSRAGSMHPELRGKHILGHTIRTDRYRYTEWGEGEYGRELYDYENDPEEYTNLAGKPQYARLEARLKQLLAQKRATAR